WREAVRDENSRVVRVAYKLCVLRAVREAIRRREIWIAGASRWRNPEQDLPADFEQHRDVHYDAQRQPRDPIAFIATLQDQVRRALEALEAALASGKTGGVTITRRRGEPWLGVPHLDKLPEPANLGALKDEV